MFWYVTLCNPIELHMHFGDIYCLRLHCRRLSRVLLAGYLLGLPLNREDVGGIFFRKL
jgi:hypothetical protein